MTKQLLGCTYFVHLALVHEDDFVAHLACKTHLMRDHHQRHALLGQILDHAQHFAHQLGVQRRGDLVAEQNFGVHGQRPCNRYALLLAARQLIGHGVKLFS